MENDTQTDYFYDILQSLALIHSELAQIRQLLEKNKDSRRVQKTLKAFKPSRM